MTCLYARCQNSPSPGTVYCRNCANMRTERQREQRQARINAGLCYRCGKRPPMEPATRCQRCADADWEYRMNKIATGVANYPANSNQPYTVTEAVTKGGSHE